MSHRLSCRALAASLLFVMALSVGTPSRAAADTASDWPDQLVVYVIPAPRPLDWRKPRRLALTALSNRIAFRHRDNKHSIGHVFVRVRSSSTGRDELTGMTSRVATEDRDLILEDEYGLGVLGADMMGRLEDAEDLRLELAERARTGLIASMRFLVSPSSSARMIQFLDEFEAKGLDDHYGGANRPRYGEGGGCSAFGLAFMELGGLMEPDYQAWRVDFRVPLAQYGGPLTGLRAPLRRVIWAGDRWAEESEPHVRSAFWDPTLMYQWIRRTWKDESREPSGRWLLETHDEMVGLAVDAREQPVPDEPIWLQQEPGTPHPYGRQASVRRDVSRDLPGEDEFSLVRPALVEILKSFGEAFR